MGYKKSLDYLDILREDLQLKNAQKYKQEEAKLFHKYNKPKDNYELQFYLSAEIEKKNQYDGPLLKNHSFRKIIDRVRFYAKE